jgi:hypothetical protein
MAFPWGDRLRAAGIGTADGNLTPPRAESLTTGTRLTGSRSEPGPGPSSSPALACG